MSIWLKTIDGQTILQNSLLIIYDLEFIGEKNDFENAHIWEIAAQTLYKPTEKYHSICFPVSKGQQMPKQHSHKPYFKVTSPFLNQQNAVSKNTSLRGFIRFIMKRMVFHRKSYIVLMSHGNMKSDKIVLEHECKKIGIHIPRYIYFFDTFPFFRNIFKSISRYDLQSVYNLTGLKHPAIQTHRAMEDVHMLQRIFDTNIASDKYNIPRLDGSICPAHLTPLQTLKGIGHATEKRLMLCYGVTTVEQLIQRAVTCKAITVGALERLLEHYINGTTSTYNNIALLLIHDVRNLCLAQRTIATKYDS